MWHHFNLPLKEAEKEEPRAILGMFDVSARPMVEREILTLSMPYSLFLKLLENISGSFLETESWKKVRQRIQNNAPLRLRGRVQLSARRRVRSKIFP